MRIPEPVRLLIYSQTRCRSSPRLLMTLAHPDILSGMDIWRVLRLDLSEPIIAVNTREKEPRKGTDMPINQGQWRSVLATLFGLAVSFVMVQAYAQLAPTGGHYAARPSDTGFAGAVNSSGGYNASVPLDLPQARGGMPVPISSMVVTASVPLAWAGTCRSPSSFATQRLRTADP
jgi:hypothetical protein